VSGFDTPPAVHADDARVNLNVFKRTQKHETHPVIIHGAAGRHALAISQWQEHAASRVRCPPAAGFGISCHSDRIHDKNGRPCGVVLCGAGPIHQIPPRRESPSETRTMTFLKNITLAVLLASMAADAESLSGESPEGYNNRMKWFAEAQYGMFIHFGAYSLPGGQWKGAPVDWYAEWLQATANIPRDEYAWIIRDFNPVDFDAEFIVRTAKEAGMTYLVITSKHHEGFCLWDSRFTEFDVAATPFKGRDILDELRKACDRHGIRFGLYYSIIDWNHPAQKPSMKGAKPMSRWGQTLMEDGRKQEYLDYQTNQVIELIRRYRPALLWFDGDWVDWWTMEDGIRLYNTIRREDPAVIVNNRVAKREAFELDYVTQEQKHFAGEYLKHWEACYTMNKSWGYKSQDREWKSADTVYEKLRDINGKGGNLLLNVGPDGRGVIQPEALDILRETARLLRNNPVVKKIPEITATPGIIEPE
jgi:alpha-L-fucosidase